MRNIQLHLTDEEFVAFVLEDVPVALEKQLDRHLERCTVCTERLQTFYIADETFPVDEWESRHNRFATSLRRKLGVQMLLKRLSAQLHALVLPRTPLSVSLAVAHAATGHSLEDGETEDGSLRWRIVEDEEKNLTIRLASHHLELEDVQFKLQAGPWHKEVTLRRVAPDQVGAGDTILAKEREELPVDVALNIRLVGANIAVDKSN